MKKFTFMLLAAFIAVTAMAAGPQKRDLMKEATPFKPLVQLGQKINAKQAPKELTGKIQTSSRARAPKKAATAADYVGDYTWDYEQSSQLSTDLENLETTAGSARVTIAESTTTEGGITISGMFPNDLEATIVSDEYGDYFTIAGGTTAGTSSYGDYVINGLFYYEGDEESDAGWYYSDIYGYIQEDGSIYIDNWIGRVLSTGDYAGYTLTPYWVGGSTLTAADPLTVVTIPEGLVAEEYSVSYQDKDGNELSHPVYAGFNITSTGADVYVQGIATWLPEAWMKGTLDMTTQPMTVTFPSGQYFGTYNGKYDMFLNSLKAEDVVCEIDLTTMTFSVKNEYFLVDNSQYYFDWYAGAKFSKVVEKAIMPANPAITSLENGNYGWVFTFNVPTLDVNGDALSASKLYYMIYTDVEGTILPLTFTPATHSRLTEDLTEIPYGFTEDYDFYDGTIYLNDLFSEDWNNLGIQSIYYGGGEVNATEIQWYHIKDYYVPETGDFTFDFNAMDVATSSSVSTDGDITETLELTEGVVTLAISPKEEGKTTENRFWNASGKPQLRVYSGTLTFSVPEGNVITAIAFNHNGKWGANTVNEIEIPNDADNKVATWTPADGEALASEVVVAIAANSQINSIVVTVAAGGDEPEGDTYTFDDGTLEGWTTIDADGDGYNWANTINSGATLSAHNGSAGALYSQSYANQTALNPDNYLVSPKVQLGGKFSFFAVAQDASWPAEHFGVFVSTKGNTDPADFEKVEEWTLTKARMSKRALVPNKVQGKWYQYIVDLSAFEGQEGYVAIRHFDCSDMFMMLVDDITFGTPAGPDPIIEPDELVELPEGVEPIEYTLTAVGATSQGDIDIEATMNVAFDGTDVYLQGLAYYFPESYVKGTLTEDGLILVPTGQFVGEDEYGSEYIVALDVDEDNYFIDADNFAFTYDAESGVIALASLYGESSTKDADGLWDYFYEATYTPGAIVIPDPVVAPEDLQTSTWYLSCESYNGKIHANELQVGFYNTDVYVQGLCEYLPEAWVKGTFDPETFTVTLPTGQFYGTYAGQYDLFFVGYDPDAEEISDVVFNIDLANGVITTDQWILLNGKMNSISFYDYYYDIVITNEKPEVPEVVEAPEDLVAEAYYFQGFDTYYQEDVTGEVQVGFYGENEVYIQGLSGYVPEAWVVGTIEDGVVTVPETYLGIYSSLFGDSELFFSGATFVYDAEAGTLTSEEGYVTYETPEDDYWMDEYTNVVLTKLNDVAATPADPEITDIKTVGRAYPVVYFNIPTEDVNGDPIMQAKLAYQLYVEKDGEVTPLVLEAAIYDELEEDMSEIPYGFSDGWDIYSGTIYLNQGEEEIASWDKIGIQSIYYGGGEVNKSNIAWMGLDTPVTVGEALYATYVAPVDVDFTGSAVKAFAITINPETECATLNPVTTVPAGEAVVVKAEKAGTYAAYKTEDAVLGTENLLVAAITDVVADGNQYVLANKEQGIGFYMANPGTTIAAGKGYLDFGTSNPDRVKSFYPIDLEDATGIAGINADNENALIYNISGQRLNKVQKGINIINGKKILK